MDLFHKRNKNYIHYSDEQLAQAIAAVKDIRPIIYLYVILQCLFNKYFYVISVVKDFSFLYNNCSILSIG